LRRLLCGRRIARYGGRFFRNGWRLFARWRNRFLHRWRRFLYYGGLFCGRWSRRLFRHGRLL
jgi:hypothetical protein